MSSSDLPLNITPEMTSIHPGRLACWNMEHARCGRRKTCERRVVEKVPAILRIFWGYPIVMLSIHAGFQAPTLKEIAVNKAELTSALAMRTKMSKADATRTVEALFDDKGIIATELKKGAKVQITGFGNFEARKRAAENGPQSKDRRCHSDQGVDRAGVPRGQAAEDGGEQQEVVSRQPSAVINGPSRWAACWLSRAIGTSGHASATNR